MRTFTELRWLLLDFVKIATNNDYFHQPPDPGWWVGDKRRYYLDLHRKANWVGPYDDGIPVLYVPAWRKRIAFPIMVLQYGLAALDNWLLQPTAFEQAIRNTFAYLRGAYGQSDSLSNHFVNLNPGHQFHSDNSCMAQGQALSFFSRAARCGRVLTAAETAWAQSKCERIAENMLRPVECGGTAITAGQDLYFCEVARTDGYIVLNGWIFGLFGLIDYVKWNNDLNIMPALERSIATLRKISSEYICDDGWSVYDNRGRLCSPFYHALHIAQFEVIAQLFPCEAFRKVHSRLLNANTAINKTWYTAAKVVDKLRDRNVYTTGGRH